MISSRLKFLIRAIPVIYILMTGYRLSAQNQQLADSLISVLEKQTDLSDSVETHYVYLVMLSSSSPEDILHYSDMLEKRSDTDDKRFYLINALLHRGIAHRFRGSMEKSLKYLFESANLSLDSDFPGLAAEAYMEIAATYTSNDNISAAVTFERKGIEIMRKFADDEQLAISLLNIGFSYYSLGKYDSALMYYSEAAPIFDRIDLAIGRAYLTGNRALVYWKQNKYSKAETGLLNAIQQLKPLGDSYGMADYYNQLGNLYFENNRIDLAGKQGLEALRLADESGLNEQIRDAMQLLAKVHDAKGDHRKAYTYQQNYLLYKDSVENLEQVRKLADMRQDFEVNLKEKEIDLLEQEKRLVIIYVFIACILLILAVVFILYLSQRNKNARLIAMAERKQLTDQVDELLKNQENKALAAMVQGRENERKRLAHDLHNHFGSLLATIKVNINALEQNNIPNHDTLVQLIDQACTDMRSISHTLNMGISAGFGLVPALTELLKHISETKKLSVEFEAGTCRNILESETEITVYRIVQELVSNCLKHADATKLSILLTCFEEEKMLNILVADNGTGFDPAAVTKTGDGMGIRGLTDMVESRNGQLHIDSNKVSGTTVTIDLPIVTNEDDF